MWVGRALGLLLVTAAICGGCATRRPLTSLLHRGGSVVRVQKPSENSVPVTTESAHGHNARQASGGGGLIGLAVGELVATSTTGRSKPLMQELRRQTGCHEVTVLEQAIKTQLSKAGLAWSDETGDRTLAFRVNSVRLQELQRGFWQVCAEVTATVRDAEQKVIWRAYVNSNSLTLRSLEEFSRQPQLYADDFREAAEDASRQLVFGPIRDYL